MVLLPAMIETMRLVGMTISVAIAGMIFAVFLGNARILSPLPGVFMPGFRLSFMIFFGVSVLCLVTILTLKRQDAAGNG